jgi:DNA-binding MarR family transcriptional regulator
LRKEDVAKRKKKFRDGRRNMNDTPKSKILRELMRLMERKLGALKAGKIAGRGVTMAQVHALVEIGRAGSLSLVDLSKLLDLDNSTMSRTVHNLVTSGLAARELDPQDRRYVTIRLTDDGTTLFKDVEEEMDRHYEHVYKTIPEENREEVLESLQVLLKALQTHEGREIS